MKAFGPFIFGLTLAFLGAVTILSWFWTEGGH